MIDNSCRGSIQEFLTDVATLLKHIFQFDISLISSPTVLAMVSC